MSTSQLKLFAQRAQLATNVQEKLLIGLVQNDEQIFEATHLDVRDFKHVLENFGLKHGFKHHGNQSVEAPRGQRAVTVDDAELMPAVVSAPDKITFDGLSKHSKQPVVGFEKRFGNEIFVYKAEVRKGKRELATQTFYVRVVR